MLRSKIVTAIVAAIFVFSSVNISMAKKPPPLLVASSSSSAPIVPLLIFVCAGGIILAAAIANARSNRQLTPHEAISCGLLFWHNAHQRRRR